MNQLLTGNGATMVDMNDFTLEDILSIEEIQKIQDVFARTNHIASTITDPFGNPITTPSNHCEVCRIVRSTEIGLKNCIRSGRILGEKSRDLMRPNSHSCHSIGFVDACAPIMVHGKHLGNWLIGQNHVGDVDEARVRQYAREIEVNKHEFLKAFEEMPKMTLEEFEKKLHFLWVLTSHISNLGYQNLRYSKMVNQLHQSQKELKQYRDQLETIVDNRTRKLQRAMEKIKQISVTDPLTKCFNRGYIAEHLPGEIERSQRYGSDLSLLMADIDHFKKINDQFGHQCGDQVLIDFVENIRSSIRRRVDWVARYGGEEFLIVLPETELRAAVRVGEKLRRKIETCSFRWMDKTLSITASFGVTGYDGKNLPPVNAEDLINSSDMYLYKAKQSGRNRVVSSPLMTGKGRGGKEV